MVSEGEFVPELCLSDNNGKNVCLADLRGKWVVLYFYPKDGTPGCTKEAIEFSSLVDNFHSLGAVIVGISRDSVESHKKFIDKYGLKIRLLSDIAGDVSRRFGVWGKKKMYGREVEGVVRSTFIIDPEGKVKKVWYNVKVAGHAVDVLESLKSLVEGQHGSEWSNKKKEGLQVP